MRRRVSSACILSWAVVGAALAQDAGTDRPDTPAGYALPHTEVIRIEASEERDVEQVLYVSLPRDYDGRDRAYPVVFLLDPDYSFAIAHNVVEHFVDRGNLPPMILVGVGYPGQSQVIETYRRHRTRDYTPTHTLRGGYGPEIQQLSGGGPAFRDFIAERVIPLIERRYRTNGERALVGHSFGGLFTTFVLLTRPTLFDRYLAVSPSYWYDDRFIFALEERAAAELDDLPARVALFIGERENPPHVRRPMVEDLRAFAHKLESRGYAKLVLSTEVFDDETHNSVFPVAITRGLRWLFSTD